jgi:hypothetical protein
VFLQKPFYPLPKIRKMKKIRQALLCCATIFTSLSMTAQQEQSLAFMTNVWQSNRVNPAIVSDKKIVVALPSVYFNLNSPDLTLNSLITKNEATGTDQLNVNNIVTNTLKPQNRLNGNVQFQTFGLTFPVTKKLFLTLSHDVWADPSVNLKGDLAKLVVKGNADPAFLGKTTAFGSSVNASVRSEFGIGAAYKLTNLTIGARVNLQYGIAALFTTAEKMDITFNQNDYNMRFQNDFEVQTYSIDKLNKIKNIQDLVSNGLTSGNMGMSFDLGGSYKMGKLTLNASMIDLGGSIKWTNEAKSYSSKGDYTYKGVNPTDNKQFFRFDSLSATYLTDTLKKIVGLVESTSGVSHTQQLPTKIYLMGSYELNDKWTLGALFYSEFGGNCETRTGFNLDATTQLFNIFRVGATVGLRNNTLNNIGAHISAKLGPVQAFAVTDNIITVFQPYSANNANGRVGVNLMF